MLLQAMTRGWIEEFVRGYYWLPRLSPQLRRNLHPLHLHLHPLLPQLLQLPLHQSPLRLLNQLRLGLVLAFLLANAILMLMRLQLMNFD